jgi:hypothetical protein
VVGQCRRFLKLGSGFRWQGPRFAIPKTCIPSSARVETRESSPTVPSHFASCEWPQLSARQLVVGLSPRPLRLRLSLFLLPLLYRTVTFHPLIATFHPLIATFHIAPVSLHSSLPLVGRSVHFALFLLNSHKRAMQRSGETACFRVRL